MDMSHNEYKYITSTCWDRENQPLTFVMKKGKYTGRYRLGLNKLFNPDSKPFKTPQMSINLK